MFTNCRTALNLWTAAYRIEDDSRSVSRPWTLWPWSVQMGYWTTNLLADPQLSILLTALSRHCGSNDLSFLRQHLTHFFVSHVSCLFHQLSLQLPPRSTWLLWLLDMFFPVVNDCEPGNLWTDNQEEQWSKTSWKWHPQMFYCSADLHNNQKVLMV